jgi:ADP-ribose pyrophosphatase
MTEDWSGPVADGGEPLPVHARRTRYEGRIWSVVSDDVDFGAAVVTRDLIVHPGAVAVIALDDEDRVLLIRQYRHPVGMHLFEPPAGLLDVPGEPPLLTAQRELAEEAGYAAEQWNVLIDAFTTPGGSSEAIRVFLARRLAPIPGGRQHTGEAEEAHLPRVWVPLDEARALVLGGAVGSPTAVSGILAAWVERSLGWSGLRPGDAPWPVRDRLQAADRVQPLHRAPDA